ncbi:MAG: hydrogenase, partial [Deltaproteobacteria bacterium]|nr:hydrogenase [Deltaproteobacteria bacterium]
MSDSSQLTYAEIDQTVLDTLRPPTGAYWLVIMVLIMGVLLGVACWIYQIFVGIGAG